jgi:very-short-patch-repair endonuclease
MRQHGNVTRRQLLDLRVHEGIRVTTVQRTLLDMACRMSKKTLTRAVNNALNSPYMTEAQLGELLERNRTHPSARRLKRFVDPGQGLTRSELEDALLDFCRRHDLPRPRTNVPVNGYLVDALFEAEQLIVELDSWQFHSSRSAFETDRTRDADALALGIPTVRITHERLESDPEHEADRLKTILDAARATRDGQPAPRRAPGRRAH